MRPRDWLAVVFLVLALLFSVQAFGEVRNPYETDPVAGPLAAAAADSSAATSQKVDRVVSGTEPLDGLLLDVRIGSWSEIGLTYTDAVRLNSEIIITNNSVWTGWMTTGSLLTNGAIFLLEGQYLQSPVQSNGVSSYSFSEESHQNGTSLSINLVAGTNIVLKSYKGTNAVLKITAGSTIPGCTAGVSISNASIIGYVNVGEAASDKKVSGLKIIDPPTDPIDAVNKLYSDEGDAAARGYADSQIAAYDENEGKTVKCSEVRLNKSWRMASANQQEFILSCGEISGDGQLVGTSNYFAFAQNDYPLLKLSSDATGLYINGFSVTKLDATNTTVTLNIATNGVTDQPFAEWALDLNVGAWTRVITYSTNTYPAVAGSNYVLRFTAPTGSKGFFRAMQPAGLSRMTVLANVLDLNSNAVHGVAAITMTNGWKIICSTNGIQFVAP